MSIDLQNDTLLTLSQAADLFPRDAQGRRVHVETLPGNGAKFDFCTWFALRCPGGSPDLTRVLARFVT